MGAWVIISDPSQSPPGPKSPRNPPPGPAPRQHIQSTPLELSISQISFSKTPHSWQQIGFTAPQNAANMCGDDTHSRPRFSDFATKRGDFATKSNAGRRFRGILQVFMQGPIESRWGIAQPIRGRPQFPYIAHVLGIPLARSMKQNFLVKSVCLEEFNLNN